MASFTDTSAQNSTLKASKIELLALKAISNYNSPITLADIQVKTGLSLFDTEDALSQITQKYICSLEVNQKGEILYNFGKLQLRKPNKRNLFFKILKFTKYGFFFIAKLIITLVFFSYVFTIGAVIALLISILAKNPQPVLFLFVSVYQTVKMLFTDTKSFFTNEIPKNQSEEKNLVAMTFAYAFGSVIPEDELKREQEIAEYIRLNLGIISTADLMLITGWDYAKCNQELTYLLTHFNGSPKVSEQGIIIYSFPDLNKTEQEINENKAQNTFFTWNNLAKPLAFNRNPKEINKIIGFVAWFSLISSLIVFSFLSKSYNILADSYLDIVRFSLVSKLGLLADDAQWIYISFWLLVFFILFLIASLVSKIPVNRGNKLRKNLNTRKKLLKRLFSNLPTLPEDQLLHISEKERFLLVNSSAGETKINEQTAKIEYDFSFIHLELKTAEQFRERAYSYQFPTTPAIQPNKLLKSNPKKYSSIYILVAILVLAGGAYLGKDYLIKFKPITLIQKELFSKELIIDFKKNNEYDSLFNEKYLKIKKKGGKIIFINGSPGDKLPEEIKQYDRISFRNCIFPIEIPEKVTVSDLEFINCKIDSFPKFQTNYIERLRIDNCGIKKLPFEFKKNHRLKQVYLTHNLLTNFPSQLVVGKNLREVDLSNNLIKILPDTIQSESNFVRLNISNNQIERLPDLFWEYKLQAINVSGNPIKKFPPFIQIDKNRVGIQSIYAANCELKEMPDISKIRYAQSFDFSNNEITTFAEGFCKADATFNVLHLQNNKITKIPACLAQNTHLRFLNISNNPLKDFPIEFESRKKDIQICINEDMPELIKAKIIKTVSKSSVFFKAVR